MLFPPRNKEINNTVLDIIVSIFRELKGRLFKSLGLSILFFIVYFLFGYFIFRPFMSYFNTVSRFSPIIMIVLVSPLIEEYVKRISIFLGTTFFFGLFFILFEVGYYVFYMMNNYRSLWSILLLRTPAALMHITTILIQKKHINGEQANLGFWFAVMVHVVFNMPESYYW